MSHEQPFFSPTDELSPTITNPPPKSGELGPLDPAFEKQLRGEYKETPPQTLGSRELLSNKDVTFEELMHRIDIKTSLKTGRKHMQFNTIAFEIALKDIKTPDEIGTIYTNLTQDWNNLKDVDNPTKPIPQFFLEYWKAKITDPKEKERMAILEALGEEAGMAAHSEQVGYNAMSVIANYLFFIKELGNNKENYLEFEEIKRTYQEKFSFHKFTPQEQQIIVNVGIAGLLHDIAKGQPADEELILFLQKQYGLTDEQVKGGISKYVDILTSPFPRSPEQLERMPQHTIDGQKILKTAEMPEFHQTVAANHHTYEFRVPQIDIYNDISGRLANIVIIIKDGGHVSISIRSYKDDNPIKDLIVDKYNIRYLLEYISCTNDHNLYRAYMLFIAQLDAIAGNTFQEFKERALAKV
ncbi:MAG TPA: hypothetical protein VLF89_07655 [Candidatus Saccharimonadales bacterium]|nr:hypothetical protein [Candidatus Saccharimonadales bacterium]